MDDKQQNFYKRLLINIRVKCLKQGIKKSEYCLKQGRKISDICLKQGQGMRGRAAPPHPGINSRIFTAEFLQQNFYKRLLINIRVKCLKQGIKKSEYCVKQGRKIIDICLKQGQGIRGMRGRAAPPHPGIHRVPHRESRLPCQNSQLPRQGRPACHLRNKKQNHYKHKASFLSS